MKLRLWVDVAEIVASLAVVASLAILIVQIKEGNRIEQAQSTLRQAQFDAQLFLLSDDLPNILAKIKAVDGYELQPLIDRYDLSYAEAAAYNRWLFLMWRGVEADFLMLGPSERLAQIIIGSAHWPDQKIYMDGAFFSDAPIYGEEFTNYVHDVLKDAR